MNNSIVWKNKHLPCSDPAIASVDVYAHRGSTLLAPENTATAFAMALSHGADVLEIDVRLSRDEQVIVTHDARVDRTCDAGGEVAQLNLQQLKRLDAAFHFTGLDGQTYRNKGIQLLTLDELFVQFPNTRINIDIKDKWPQAAAAVARSIDKAACQHRVNVGSFHALPLRHFRQYAPTVSTTANQKEVAQLYFLNQLPKRSPTYRFLQIPVHYFGLPLASPGFITRAQSKGINVVYWTINTQKAMQMLINRGAQGIVTDRVDLACELLNKSAETNH